MRPSLAILLGLVLFPLAVPLPASAQLDSRCFTRSECMVKRQAFLVEAGQTDETLAEGFVVNAETKTACGERIGEGEGNELGFCLPAGKTTTKIGFAGQRDFTNIGQFIQYMYRFGIVLAGLLATIMIIAAGFEWITSGGNSERISSARKRIGGAIVGLSLAVLSYFILNLVNPYLVNFRVPQVWLIKTQQDIPAFCSNLQAGTELAVAKTQEEQLTVDERQIRLKNAQDNNQFTVTKERAECKMEYFVKDAGGQTCRGSICPQRGGRPQTCAPSQNDPNMHECVEATIVGRIYNGDIRTLFPDIANAFAAETWEWPWTDEGETEIWGLCMNGATFELPSSNQTINEEREGIQFQRYYIKLQVNDVTGEVIKACGDKNKLKGFYLTAEMNQNYNTTDETHAIGASGTTGKDLGTLDTFERTKTTIPTANLISLERLTNGVNLDIDAGAIKNID